MKVKPNAKEAITSLKHAGIEKTVMLTGDSKKVADQVAKELGIGEVYSELLPADKVSKVEELLKEKNAKAKLVFVGDGINDAPVLSRADIGIAMGALGSDAAIEAADVVLMDDDPAKIATAMKISRKTIRIVHQNIVFALAVKALCLFFGAIGFVNMWWAIFADTVILPIWDICGFKEEARINTPGTVSNKNWTWKLKDFKTFPDKVMKTKEWIEKSNR